MNCSYEFSYFITHDPPVLIKKHTHLNYELVYYNTGSGIMIIDGETYNYTPDFFTFTCPGSSHEEKHFEPTQVSVIAFQASLISDKLRSGMYKDRSDKKIKFLLQKIQSELMNKLSRYEDIINLIIEEIMIEIERMQIRTVDLNNIEKARQYIDQNYTQKIDIKTLSNLTNYSYHHFRHEFRKQFGISPINYTIHRRLEEAKNLIVNSNLSISTISLQCGFSNISQFIRFFKRQFVCSPSEYRKRKS